METTNDNQEQSVAEPPAKLSVENVDVDFLPIIYDIIKGIERDPHDATQKTSGGPQDISQKVIELHKKLELAKEQVNNFFFFLIYSFEIIQVLTLGIALVHFSLNPRELPKRIISSFIPPLGNIEYRKVYVDFLGPLIAVFLLALILQCGHLNKHQLATLDTSPSLVLAYYILIMPLMCLLLAKMGQSNLDAAQIISLIGYALYGHVFTISICYLLGGESNHYLFFFFMIIFGGTSCLRIVIILLITIPKPVARLFVCSFVSIFHLLFLIFIHYGYMHQTFIFGKNHYKL
ncbi:hypothetical protein O3M35_000649 [Rhynocoris fuscipes]|uniref:Mediator of RNA polymerase II transcription subunit 9 n=1 Tax=Rhynocoris fuscipes TaxID=488301 RepID=A0AAW1DQY6_9HEMI